MASFDVGGLGEFLREQRRQARLSLRQLAAAAGVSNPYLSQIERGLRKPSAEILQQIAKGLRISAEALYVQAGILEDREADTDVQAAVRDDLLLTERQKQVLLDIYASFLKENEAAGIFPGGDAEPEAGGDAAESDAAESEVAESEVAARAAARGRAGRVPDEPDVPERAMSEHTEQDGKEEVG
jgi:transcriptional regulator with XRE-family HTH domain